ncbi:MAG TPA: hypothetical protein GXZ36_09065 [Firmicutes bacterium]|jgi:hypothetical protein|nr:hypothetical protein [Bacillota bacterium]
MLREIIMHKAETLHNTSRRSKGELAGSYVCPGFTLHIDQVREDLFTSLVGSGFGSGGEGWIAGQW